MARRAPCVMSLTAFGFRTTGGLGLHGGKRDVVGGAKLFDYTGIVEAGAAPIARLGYVELSRWAGETSGARGESWHMRVHAQLAESVGSGLGARPESVSL